MRVFAFRQDNCADAVFVYSILLRVLRTGFPADVCSRVHPAFYDVSRAFSQLMMQSSSSPSFYSVLHFFHPHLGVTARALYACVSAFYQGKSIGVV